MKRAYAKLPARRKLLGWVKGPPPILHQSFQMLSQPSWVELKGSWGLIVSFRKLQIYRRVMIKAPSSGYSRTCPLNAGQQKLETKSLSRRLDTASEPTLLTLGWLAFTGSTSIRSSPSKWLRKYPERGSALALHPQTLFLWKVKWNHQPQDQNLVEITCSEKSSFHKSCLCR